MLTRGDLEFSHVRSLVQPLDPHHVEAAVPVRDCKSTPGTLGSPDRPPDVTGTHDVVGFWVDGEVDTVSEDADHIRILSFAYQPVEKGLPTARTIKNCRVS
jgi:hypothetical protein